MNPTRRHGLVLFFLVVVFAAPGLFAYCVYLHPEWLDSKTTNRGMFIQPPVLLNELSGDKKWRLIVWSPKPCEESCVGQLDKLARVRVALGRRLYDVDVTLLQGADGKVKPETVPDAILQEGMESVVLSAHSSAELSKLYPDSALFIANPRHYLVLRYALMAEADDVFRDIKQLLTTKG
jgi:hypothetical protein